METMITKDDHPELCRPIYTTGAMLFPIKRVRGGSTYWIWTVGEFTDDCYDEDGDVFTPPVSACSLEKLMVNQATDVNDAVNDREINNKDS